MGIGRGVGSWCFLLSVRLSWGQSKLLWQTSFPHPSVRHTGVFSYCMSATIMFLIHFYFRMWNSSFFGGGGEGCGGGGIKESLKWPSTIILPCSSWNLYLRVWSSILSCLASEEVNPHILDTLGMRKILMF